MAKKVLVVDDDRILPLRIKKECEKHSDRFSLILAENGLEAVEVLKNVCLWLKFSPALALNKIEHFSKVSQCEQYRALSGRLSGRGR